MSLELGQTNGRGGQFPVTNGTGAPAMTDLDAPLVGDVAGLRASWQRIQAEFVDDPREAVVDAAALVEHVTQTLVGTLRQRQQRLRGMWDGSAAQATFAPDTGTADGGFRPMATFTPKHASTGEADAGGPQATFTPNDAVAPDAARTSESAITGESTRTQAALSPDDTLSPDDALSADTAGTSDDVRTADSGRVPGGEYPPGDGFRDGTGVLDSAVPAGNGAPPAAAPARAGQPAAGVVADTEQLRLVLRRYRSLLDQLCPPA
jgi:hypothetical protein